MVDRVDTAQKILEQEAVMTENQPLQTVLSDEPPFDLTAEGETPQFMVPGTRKPSLLKNLGGGVFLLLILGVVVLVVSKYDSILGLSEKVPDVKNGVVTSSGPANKTAVPETIPGDELYTVKATSPDLTIPTTQAIPTSASSFPADNAGVSVATASPASSGDPVIIVMANRLQELSGAVTKLGSAFTDVVKAQAELRSQVVSQGESISKALDSIEKKIELSRESDEKRDEILNSALSEIKGFKLQVVSERNRFTFKILHDESYGGRVRIVGFEEAQPHKIIKLYEGEEVGFWRFVAVRGGKAVFLHKDGQEHLEALS